MTSRAGKHSLTPRPPHAGRGLGPLEAITDVPGVRVGPTTVRREPGCEEVRSLGPVVGECNGGLPSGIRARPVREEHVRAALDGARGGPVAVERVGAGTGTVALGLKAGVGTASRVAEVGGARHTMGVLVQADFGGTLRVLGRTCTPDSVSGAADAGSCVIVVATDAPLDARQLTPGGRCSRRSARARRTVTAAAVTTTGFGDRTVAALSADELRTGCGRPCAVAGSVAVTHHDATVPTHSIHRGDPMKIHLTSVIVDDQETALRFYTDVLGFVKKHDVPVGADRWLTVVSPEAPDGTELLLEPSGHPAVGPYRTALAQDGIPAASFAVDDVRAEFERLRGLGVRFTQEPLEMGSVSTAVLDDTCGNLIQIVHSA